MFFFGVHSEMIYEQNIKKLVHVMTIYTTKIKSHLSTIKNQVSNIFCLRDDIKILDENLKFHIKKLDNIAFNSKK